MNKNERKKTIGNLKVICAPCQQLKRIRWTPSKDVSEEKKFLVLEDRRLEILSLNASNQNYETLWLGETVMILKENRKTLLCSANLFGKKIDLTYLVVFWNIFKTKDEGQFLTLSLRQIKWHAFYFIKTTSKFEWNMLPFPFSFKSEASSVIAISDVIE